MPTNTVPKTMAAVLGAYSVLAVPQRGSAQVRNESRKLLPADGAASDEFGSSVSISSDVILAGAPNDDHDEVIDAGAAYVFRRTGPLWMQEQKLMPADGGEGDAFGTSVSVSGDVAVVGAELNDDLATDAGSAYVFRWDGAAWDLEQKLLAFDAAENDGFGGSVSISGDVALIGAELDNDLGNAAGSAYVFRFNAPGFAGTWMQEQELLASDGTAADFFGAAVSVSADVAVVGAPVAPNDDGVDSGAAYVFRWNGAAWVEEQKLLALDGGLSDTFGTSVSIAGDVIVVGARFDDAIGANSGSAYVFRWNGSSWEQEQKLLPSDGTGGDEFGISVSVSGDVAVVGAHRHADNAPISGAAYVFRWNGALWSQEEKLLASDGALGDVFGTSVSISGSVAAVGAPNDDDQGSASGSAYVFLGLCADDSDGDGACDRDDVCPLTPKGVPVDASGRPAGDLDGECDTDMLDFQLFQQEFDGDLAVFQLFQEALRGPI